MAKKLTPSEKNLIRRYLVWCYKTTKEELDRTDRKFTQLTVDYFLRAKLKAGKGSSPAYQKLVAGFGDYIAKKEHEARASKFLNGKTIQAGYLYLRNRQQAVEKAIVAFLGRKTLTAIEADYEKEMIRRIWEAREH